MEYIRTKDKIIDTADCEEGFLCKQKCWQPLKGFLVYEQDIVKQADNIKELCDCLVVKTKDDKMPYIESMSELKNLKMLNDFGGAYGNNLGIEFVYGAIWTDKGLIYVAKLNDKGEWELI